jgi:hemoglobin
MKDITNRMDIEKLMRAFYAKILVDEVIGHYFTEVMHLDLETHIPVLCDFWEGILFQTGNYQGAMFQKHLALDEKSHFEQKHFTRWTDAFIATTNELFAGEKAELAKQRALSISIIMQSKMLF